MGSEGGDESGPPSPKSKMKFLCSYGGKILPRPTDGQLKYVGGETRVVAVRRDITISEFMKKLSTLYDGEMILKYQIMAEDLDALVSVKSDEDLKHMVDEYDRLESEGTPKLRAFLFPPNLVVQVTHTDPHAVEQQRYIDAINGVVPAASNAKLAPIIANRISISSACSSPKSTSPEANNADMGVPSHSSRLSLPKVHSFPSLCSLSTPQTQASNGNNQIHQQHTHYYQNHTPYQQPNMYVSPRLPPDIPKGIGSDRLPSTLSFGRNEMRSPMGPQYYSLSRQNSGNFKYGCYDEFPSHGCGRLERSDSNPRSPMNHAWL